MGMNPKPTEGKQVGPFGILMMVAFWLLVWALGPSLFTYEYSLKGLTFTYLVITMLVLFLISRAKGVSFGAIIGNNDWVFPSIFMMAVVSVVMNSANPYIPAAPLRQFWGWLTDNPVLVDPWAEDSFFGHLNNSFFGSVFTHGWRDAAWAYGLWSIPAIFVSYTDEVIKLLKEVGESQNGEEWKPFVKKYVVLELLKIPLKAVFRGLSGCRQG